MDFFPLKIQVNQLFYDSFLMIPNLFELKMYF